MLLAPLRGIGCDQARNLLSATDEPDDAEGRLPAVWGREWARRYPVREYRFDVEGRRSTYSAKILALTEGLMSLEAVRAGFNRAWQERDHATIVAVARTIPEKVLQEDQKLQWFDLAVTRSGEEV